MSLMWKLIPFDRMSQVNIDVARPLMNKMQLGGLISSSPECLIGSDGADGMSIRWPSARLFCDVSEGGSIIVSYVSHHDNRVQNFLFDANETTEVCDKVASFVCKMK